MSDKIQELEKKRDAFMEVVKNPDFKKYGVSVHLLNNSNIIVQTGEREDPFSHSLSKEDSLNILNIIKMSIDEYIKANTEKS